MGDTGERGDTVSARSKLCFAVVEEVQERGKGLLIGETDLMLIDVRKRHMNHMAYRAGTRDNRQDSTAM